MAKKKEKVKKVKSKKSTSKKKPSKKNTPKFSHYYPPNAPVAYDKINYGE